MQYAYLRVYRVARCESTRELSRNSRLKLNQARMSDHRTLNQRHLINASFASLAVSHGAIEENSIHCTSFLCLFLSYFCPREIGRLSREYRASFATSGVSFQARRGIPRDVSRLIGLFFGVS